MTPQLSSSTLALCLPSHAVAWGYEGHQVIAAIAEGYLTPRAGVLDR